MRTEFDIDVTLEAVRPVQADRLEEHAMLVMEAVEGLDGPIGPVVSANFPTSTIALRYSLMAATQSEMHDKAGHIMAEIEKAIRGLELDARDTASKRPEQALYALCG